jgi:hypothetical protein
MNNYIIFYPKDIDNNDEPKDTVLWEVKYNVHESMLGLPDHILSLLKEEHKQAYPLEKWHHELTNLGMQIIYDYVYAKEYAYFVQNIPFFTATLSALDLNRFNNQIVIKQKIGKKLLKEMNLRNQGSMHPERFHKRMIELTDISEDKFLIHEDICDALINLENLCERCVQYESQIQWKSIC